MDVAEGIAINNVYHVVILNGSTSLLHEVNSDNFPNQWFVMTAEVAVAAATSTLEPN